MLSNNEEDPILKRNRSWTGLALVFAVLLMAVLMLGDKLPGVEDKTVTYPELLQMIREDKVQAVAIRDASLVGLTRDTKIAEKDFPDKKYDFETTIGADFIETVRQMEAARRTEEARQTAEEAGLNPAETPAVSVETISVSDLPFRVIYRAAEDTTGLSILLVLMQILLPIGAVVLLWFFIMRSQNQGGSQAMSFGKSKARVADPAKNKVTFDDVAGADEEKEELQEMVDFLRNPRTYIDMGARIPKGVLLVGPPGTGKTLLAKAVAGEAGVPFFSISGSDFMEMFVGVGASRVRDLFDQAKRAAPAIIFIDEIDAIGRHRGSGLGGGHDEREQTLNQILVEMDGFAANEGVIVMAATNRGDILDPALTRPGRFDRNITVDYPDINGRVAILKVHAKGKPLAADVDLELIAKRTPFATGADLENMLNEAAILAARSRRKEIDQQLLMDAIARVQMGPEKRSRKVTDRDRRIVAIHEGGHAIVGHMLPDADDVHLVTIVPRGRTGGHTLSLPAGEDNMSLKPQLMADVAMFMGGHAAEKLMLGEFGTGATSDLQRATELCRRMVTMFGMSDVIGPVYLDSDQEVFVGMEFGQTRPFSEETAARVDAEVKRLCEECYNTALRVLTENRDKLEVLTEALLKHETLSRQEFVSLMETGVIPEITDAGKPRSLKEILESGEAQAEAEKDQPADGKIGGVRVGDDVE